MYNRQIQTFIQVADCGSLSKAAEKLFSTSASVMKQMNALESRIGVKLLERSNHGIRLTPAGRSLYKDAQRIIREAEAAIGRARQAAGLQRYVVQVGTSLLNPCKALIELWEKIDGNHPAFQIKIVPFEDDHANILSRLAALGKTMDCMVGPCGSKQWRARCNIYILGAYRVCCAVPRKHRLAGKKLLEIADLYGERLMMVQRGDSEKLDELRDMLEESHPAVQIVDTPFFYDAEVFNRCVQTDSVLLTLDAWADLHPSLLTIPVAWNYTSPYGLLYAKKPTPDVIAFLEAIQISTASRQSAALQRASSRD